MLQHAMKTIGLISLLGLLNCILGCEIVRGSGTLATRTLDLTGVNNVTVNGIGLLSVVQDATENLVIEADDNVLPYVISDVANNSLNISIKNNVQITPSIPLVYRVNVKDISKIASSGAIQVQTQELKAAMLAIDLSGTTTMNGRLAVSQLQFHASGSNQITLTGTADVQNISTEGSVTFDGSGLSGKSASINASGSVDMTLNVIDKINGSISGAGTVLYLNNPTTNVQTSGATSIRKK